MMGPRAAYALGDHAEAHYGNGCEHLPHQPRRHSRPGQLDGPGRVVAASLLDVPQQRDRADGAKRLFYAQNPIGRGALAAEWSPPTYPGWGPAAGSPGAPVAARKLLVARR